MAPRTVITNSCLLLTQLVASLLLSGCIGETVDADQLAFASPDEKKAATDNACTSDKDCAGDACVAAVCKDGQCAAGAAVSCEDNNPCTADSCSEQGCVNEPLPNGSGCDDRDLCTSGDPCAQ